MVLSEPDFYTSTKLYSNERSSVEAADLVDYVVIANGCTYELFALYSSTTDHE